VDQRRRESGIALNKKTYGKREEVTSRGENNGPLRVGTGNPEIMDFNRKKSR